MSRLDELAASWEAQARSGEHMGIVSVTLLGCAKELRQAIGLLGTLEVVKREPRAEQVPGQLEAFAGGGTTCVRCGRELKHPEWLNGAPFGRNCVRRELLGEGRRGPTRAPLEVRSHPGGGDAPVRAGLRMPMPPGGVRPAGAERGPEREAEPLAEGGE